uniref:Argonaute family member n=1 Tax=Physcomitrium patens TaxID=3218 RepID=A0A7I4BLH5_PHYPA
MDGAEVMSGMSEVGLPLPPPPPVPPGAFPAISPGYEKALPPSGLNREPNEGHTGHDGTPKGASGSSAPISPALARIPLPKKATRPSFGKLGRPSKLCMNHFKTSIVKWDDVYQYSVSIEPSVKDKKQCREIMKKLRETYGEAECGGKQGAYDGENCLFTSGSLSFNTKEFPVFLEDSKGSSYRPGDRDGKTGDSTSTHSPTGQEVFPKRRKTVSRGREFSVKIEFAATIRMKVIDDMMKGVMGKGDLDQETRALDALRVLDIVLRENASERGYLLVRDNFFHPELGPVGDLGEGVEAWRGYHSSIKPTGLGLTLNLDVTMTTILKPITVEKFLAEYFGVRDLNGLQARNWTKAKSILKGVKVETTHMSVSREHKISGFSDRAIRDLKFSRRVKDGEGNIGEEEISVQQYYSDVYMYTLRFPDLPALVSGNKKKATFLPLELCKIIAGQRYTKSLSSKQRQLQIAACKQSPQERQRICENAMEVSKYSSDKLIAEFGLKFESSLAGVTGRILRPPQLEFGHGRTEEPRDGRWNFNQKELKQGARIDTWAVAIFDGRCSDGQRIAESLVDCCCKRGMQMRQAAIVEKEPPSSQRFSPEQRVERMITALKQTKPVFILVILPDKDSPIYVPFKRFCEMKIGVVSQCMVKPRQLNDQYLGNLALKINLKMGGFNSPLSPRMVSCLGPSTIIFGMDVSHGSPGESSVPSIAAVVATKNWPDVFHYSTQVRIQPAKTEMIEGLHDSKGGMVKECLKAYYISCRSPNYRKPTQIIVYRHVQNWKKDIIPVSPSLLLKSDTILVSFLKALTIRCAMETFFQELLSTRTLATLTTMTFSSSLKLALLVRLVPRTITFS